MTSARTLNDQTTALQVSAQSRETTVVGMPFHRTVSRLRRERTVTSSPARADALGCSGLDVPAKSLTSDVIAPPGASRCAVSARARTSAKSGLAGRSGISCTVPPTCFGSRADGKSLREIGEELGVSQVTVLNAVTRPLPDKRTDRPRALYDRLARREFLQVSIRIAPRSPPPRVWDVR